MVKVGDIMTEEVLACTPDTSVEDVARLLVENGFSGMPVVESDRVVGLITADNLLAIEKPIKIPGFLGILGTAVYMDNPLDGDEVEKQIRGVLATKASELMNKDFRTVSSSLDVHELAELMIKENLDLVPVVDNDVLVGVVAKSDILALMAARKE